MLEKFVLLMAVLLGPPDQHPTVYDLKIMIGGASRASVRIQGQAQHQPNMPEDLVGIFQPDFTRAVDRFSP